MDTAGRAIRTVGDGDIEATVRFISGWVVDDGTGARAYLTDHSDPEGASLVATQGPEVLGYVAIAWESSYEGFRRRGIPLLHQISVAEPFRRQGIATALMDAAEQLARGRGAARLGITVGLFGEYGPAQRMYAQRGYVPDGRGACRGHPPLQEGEQVTVGHDLILWLTKDLGRGLSPARQGSS
jgi:GNAT superfamily N-acetyltransferase